MNLITNGQLDLAQRRAIYELTLKKRQSKKSTMSEKQVLAKQQLARELMLERIIPIEDSILASNKLYNNNNHHHHHHQIDNNSTITNSIINSIATIGHQQQANFTTSASNPSIVSNLDSDHFSHPTATIEPDQPSTSGSIDTNATSGCCSASLATASSLASSATTNLQKNHQASNQGGYSPTCSSCGCSFGRSDSSYSGSSQGSSSSARMMIMIGGDESSLSNKEDELLGLKKEANIKFQKSRLEQLNEELERKLYQYEYLVTKEKALLSAYNMVLFTNEGVNNFY